MSPIAAISVAAVVMSTPGIVISRLISGESSAAAATCRSTAAISSVRKSTWRRQRISGLALVTGQLERREPRVATLAEQITRRRAPGKIADEHRGDLVLDAGALAHQLRASRGQPAQTPGPLVLDPHGRQHAGLEQLRERARVETVRS
jgi:hypothetical protein